MRVESREGAKSWKDTLRMTGDIYDLTWAWLIGIIDAHTFCIVLF